MKNPCCLWIKEVQSSKNTLGLTKLIKNTYMPAFNQNRKTEGRTLFWMIEKLMTVFFSKEHPSLECPLK